MAATKKPGSSSTGAQSARKVASKQAPRKAAVKAEPRSMPKAGRDPKGGLTAKGRTYFNEKEGSHLRPGVVGPADTPEKMVRKGSFLRRHFTHPRGPMQDEKGQPTRLALSAHAWGEPVPKTMGDAKKLAGKGHELLERYHAAQDKATAEPSRKGAATKRAMKQAAKPAKKAATKKGVRSAKRTGQS